MKNIMLGTVLVVVGTIFGGLISQFSITSVNAQAAPSTTSGDALWHLPKFGESGWFIHAHNGMVRACNMDKASVVGEKQGPRCSNWE